MGAVCFLNSIDLHAYGVAAAAEDPSPLGERERDRERENERGGKRRRDAETRDERRERPERDERERRDRGEREKGGEEECTLFATVMANNLFVSRCDAFRSAFGADAFHVRPIRARQLSR